MISQRLCQGCNGGGEPVVDQQQVLAQLDLSYQRGEFGRVVYQADRYLQQDSLSSVRAHILYWKGMALKNTSPAWQAQAISCLREGIASAGRDRAIKARLIAGLGVIYALNGDCPAFEKILGEYVRLSKGNRPDVHKWGAFVWFNWGCALDNSFRYEEAFEAYRKATELADRFSVTRLLWSCHHNLSGVLLALGRLPEAREAMTRAEALVLDEKEGHKKLSRRAEYTLADGDLAGAQHWIAETLLHPSLDDMTRADIHLTWAQTLKALGRPQEAYEKAMQGLEFAAKDVHLPGIHRINCFLQEVGGSLYLQG